MRSPKLFLISLGCLSIIAVAQSSRAQTPPSLVADSSHNASAARGSGAQAFQINSLILKESRRIQIVLPPSFSQSAPERHYPVMIVTDGDFILAPVAAVADELTRNGQIPETVIVAI